MPIGVIEKMPSGLPPLRSIRSLASRKAGALTSVSVVPSDAASDIGISRRDAGMFCSCAWRKVIGSIIAVTITWWVNEASAATAGISTATARASLRPAARPIHRPRRSVIPVAARPPEMTNTAATMTAGSLANPDSAWSASSTPLTTSASSTTIAVTSTRRRSLMNRYNAPARIRRNRTCCKAIESALDMSHNLHCAVWPFHATCTRIAPGMGASCGIPAFGTMIDSMSDSPVPVDASDDIARLKRELAACRAELQVLREEQRTFAEGISHDLRAPLRAIDTFATLVEKDPALGEDARHHLRRVRAGATRLGGLFDALLELSRAGRAELQLQPVDLGLVAEWVVAELRDAEPARDAQLVVEAGLEVVGDERLLKSLMAQLLGNAWKFSRDRDHVSIRVSGERIAGRLHVGVHDAGCGFDMAYAGKLFQPFQRLVGSEQGGGHGLGLAIARRIVERHGGRLSARSGPGPGASFLFDLPEASAG